MKKRLSRVLNFLAFNLLFFALYLNFVHTDRNLQIPVKRSGTAVVQEQAELVTNPEQYIKQPSVKPMVTASTQAESEDAKAKLSFN